MKSGKVSVRDIRDLNGTVEREKNAKLGILVTLNKPTKNMIDEIIEDGLVEIDGTDYQKIQIITVKEILEDKVIRVPNNIRDNKKGTQTEFAL